MIVVAGTTSGSKVYPISPCWKCSKRPAAPMPPNCAISDSRRVHVLDIAAAHMAVRTYRIIEQPNLDVRRTLAIKMSFKASVNVSAPQMNYWRWIGCRAALISFIRLG
jgi:hypothetical protein